MQNGWKHNSRDETWKAIILDILLSDPDSLRYTIVWIEVSDGNTSSLPRVHKLNIPEEQ